MKNKEKYAKEILDIACAGEAIAIKNGVPCTCDAISCDECDLDNGAGCNNTLIKWCNSEYVKPSGGWQEQMTSTFLGDSLK